MEETGKCENCGKEVNKKYKYCKSCVDNYKKDTLGTETHTSNVANADVCEKLDSLIDILNKINWNFGMLVATLRKDDKLIKKLIDVAEVKK
jgi:hypothetical protein